MCNVATLISAFSCSAFISDGLILLRSGLGRNGNGDVVLWLFPYAKHNPSRGCD